MIEIFLLAAALGASREDCIDHSAYSFGLPDIVQSEAGGRAESRTFPDGTQITIRAEYCTEPAYQLDMDAPLDAQNGMRLRQVMGQFDRHVSCPVSDWSRYDVSIAAAVSALDAGEAFDNDGAPIDGDGVNAIYLSLVPAEGRVQGTFRCLRPQD